MGGYTAVLSWYWITLGKIPLSKAVENVWCSTVSVIVVPLQSIQHTAARPGYRASSERIIGCNMTTLLNYLPPR